MGSFSVCCHFVANLPQVVALSSGVLVAKGSRNLRCRCTCRCCASCCPVRVLDETNVGSVGPDLRLVVANAEQASALDDYRVERATVTVAMGTVGRNADLQVSDIIFLATSL